MKPLIVLLAFVVIQTLGFQVTLDGGFESSSTVKANNFVTNQGSLNDVIASIVGIQESLANLTAKVDKLQEKCSDNISSCYTFNDYREWRLVWQMLDDSAPPHTNYLDYSAQISGVISLGDWGDRKTHV
eukprot:TRINITY_DN477_c0_g1_i2.p1 TRINITY_DN477_c0_g1~~TRINITY_DN477_c0_g1_i2.p1  ORF type:complete len:129 (-),score=12.61 TRINITY_DN477_c0_g1_i2:93-479(-)